MAPDPESLPQSAPPAAASPIPASRGREPIWKQYRWGLLPVAIAATLATDLFRSSPQPQSELERPSALPVEVAVVEPVSQYTTERTYTGELVAQRRSALGFELGGTVVRLEVREGDQVVAGQPLARLDTRALEAQRQQLEAQRQAALAQLHELQAGPRLETITTAQARVTEIEQQLALARLQRDRREDLYRQRAISREDVDREQYNTGALESRLAQAQSQLSELETGTRTEQIEAQAAQVRQLDASLQQIAVNLDKSVLVAPFAGTVSTRVVDEGVVVSGGQPVLHFLEAAPLEARVGIPPAVADQLQLGSAQVVRVGERTFTATLSALLPEVEATSRTVTAVLQLPTPHLTVGQTVRWVWQHTQEAEGLWVPTTALVPGERGLWSIYVLAEPEAIEPSPSRFTVRRRAVEVVHTEGERTLVRGTLQTGERAITTGTHRIVPGQVVSMTP